MGVKGLWTVLTPYSEKKSLHEIRGETVAVDLSGWVCDSQNVTEYHIQPKLYLRNLFFRTVYLLLADINPIFVLEGDAPELKRDVMAARNAIQFKGAAPRSEAAVNKKKPDVARKRFKNVLKECESLLKTLGVRCVKGHGEAEATCAQLNAQGLVDAVVSQDSDCFAYGAVRVYRNFSVSNSAGGGAMQGSVDCYDAAAMYKSNGFGRNKMVALALLCGCDYGLGACGSSINTAVSFLHTIPEKDVIPRLLSWVTDTDRYEEQSRWLAAPGRCDRCGHFGRTHGKSGCPVCVTHRGCDDTGHKAKVAELKRELSLRNRALTCGAPFPEPKVMKEFMNTPPDNIDVNSLKRPTPSLIQFVKLMTNKLDWSERYCVEKFLPLLTKWHFQDNVPCRTLKALHIKKKRNPRGVPSYEVVWTDTDGQYDGLVPDDQFEDGEDPLSVWTTTERQDLMHKYYPEVVEAYEESIKKPPKEKKTRTRKKKDNENTNTDKPKRKYTKKPKNAVPVDSVNASMKATGTNTSALNVSVNVNRLKRKIKNNTKKGQKTLTSFIASKKRRTSKQVMQSLRKSFKNISLACEDNILVADDNWQIEDRQFDTKKENKPNTHYLSMLNKTDDEIEDIDLSDIIDNIISRPPEVKTATVDNKLVRLVFEKYSTPKKMSLRKSVLTQVHNNCSTPRDSPVRKSNFRFSIHSNDNSMIGKVNTSYFFDKLTEDGDAFEMSLEHKDAAVHLDSTLEYSLPAVRL
uniref:XPG-I domain-containing protein n=1 Tax=Heliothis virescens TaxID=7102 RepID=A0A2A4JQE6_HELVI